MEAGIFQKELDYYAVECNNEKKQARANFQNGIDLIVKGIS